MYAKGEYMKVSQLNHLYRLNLAKYNALQLTNQHYTNPVNKNQKDTFAKSSKISFGSYPEHHTVYSISKKKFDPLNATSSELDLYAELFHEEDIDAVLNEVYGGMLNDFFGYNDKKIQKVKDALLPRINKIKDEKYKAIIDKTELTTKLTTKERNTAENKLRITNEFLIPLEHFENNSTNHIPNGILLYGNATSKEKQEFTGWLAQKVGELGAEYKVVDCKNSNLDVTLSAIKNAVANAKQYNEFTDKHTVIHLKNIDKIISNLNDEASIDFSNHFKTICENVSSKNHLTFLITTEIPLADFDSAVIGDQRFEIKANLVEGLTDNENQRLIKISNRLCYLQDMSENQRLKLCYNAKDVTSWQGDDDVSVFSDEYRRGL